MKLEEVRSCIMQAFGKKKAITAQELAYTPYQVPNVQCYAVMKILIDAGAVTKKEKAYTLISIDKAHVALGMETPVEPKYNKVSKPTPTTKGRNTSKYIFEKVKRSKSQTVLAVIKAYVRDNKNVSYKKLLTVFPPHVKRFGTINILSAAKELSPDPKRPRYFFKDEDVIRLKNQKVVVTNQWTETVFQEFFVNAKQLGYKISLK